MINDLNNLVVSSLSFTISLEPTHSNWRLLLEFVGSLTI